MTELLTTFDVDRLVEKMRANRRCRTCGGCVPDYDRTGLCELYFDVRPTPWVYLGEDCGECVLEAARP